MNDSHIEYQSVDSSNIAAIGRDPALGHVWVKFHNGGVYVYERVKKSVYDAFLASASKGHYLWKVIRGNGTDSIYAYHKVRGKWSRDHFRKPTYGPSEAKRETQPRAEEPQGRAPGGVAIRRTARGRARSYEAWRYRLDHTPPGTRLIGRSGSRG